MPWVGAGALGSLERKCGNLGLALEYLNRALELTPRHPPACVEKAIVLRTQGKPGRAAKFTDMAVREKTQLEYKRGVTKKQAGDFVRSSKAQQVPNHSCLSTICALTCAAVCPKKSAGLCILACRASNLIPVLQVGSDCSQVQSLKAS